MAESSAIEWTDATVNFWWGCTKVGPGCDHCYAETWTRRTGDEVFGLGVPRRKIKSAVSLLYRLHNGASWWAADVEVGKLHPNSIRRVFIQSMSDLFDKEVPAEWFDEAWQAITRCDRLAIQIVTKRVSTVEKRLAGRAWPKHAGLIISVVNQAEADRDVPRLLELKAKLGIPWVGVSLEPLLGPVDLTRVCIVPKVPGSHRAGIHIDALAGRYAESGQRYIGEWDVNGPYPEGTPALALDWVIVGGESGSGARPMHPDWARSLRDQCAQAKVPFLFKQWGEYAPYDGGARDGAWLDPSGYFYGGPTQWPPAADEPRCFMCRVGKRAAGRLLDGVEHNAFPIVSQETIA